VLVAAASAVAGESYGAAPPNLNAYLNNLVSAYPDWIARYDSRFVFLKSGLKFEISDNKLNKSFDELLEKPDIDDMFSMPYPAGSKPKQPNKNFDPGRVRFEPLLVTMYGDCKRNEVLPKLRTIQWLPAHSGGSVGVTTVNGVDKALEAVSRELDGMPVDFIRFLTPSAGTYNCREIAGSTARSMHAFGAAIDINTKYSDYWRWSSKNRENLVWRNQIPIEIVRIFERHGFIWGGYWYHFDTMHFEYRPELFLSQ
jgi:hypothetical protein